MQFLDFSKNCESIEKSDELSGKSQQFAGNCLFYFCFFFHTKTNYYTSDVLQSIPSSSVDTKNEKLRNSDENFLMLPKEPRMNVFRPDNFDIAELKKNPHLLKDGNFKTDILNSNLIPSNFDYPTSEVGGKNLKFQPQWVKGRSWIAYSQSEDGVYCKLCVVFCAQNEVGKGNHENLGQLVNSCFNRWKHALQKFKDHEKTDYHKTSVVMKENYLQVSSNSQLSVNHQLDKRAKNEIEANRRALIPIIETVLFYAEEELPLRGDAD